MIHSAPHHPSALTAPPLMSTPLTPVFAALLNGLDAAYRRGRPP